MVSTRTHLDYLFPECPRFQLTAPLPLKHVLDLGSTERQYELPNARPCCAPQRQSVSIKTILLSLHPPTHALYPFFFFCFLFILPWPFRVLTTAPSTPTSTQSGHASASAKSSKSDASRQIPSSVFLLSTIGFMTCAFFAL